MKTYRLEESLATRAAWIVPAILAVLLPAMFLLGGAGKAGPPLPFFFLMPAVAVGMALFALRMPTRIEVGDDGSMEWIGPLRRIRLAPSDVISIAPDGNGQGCFILIHSAGRFRFRNQFTGFHDLLTALVRANPSIVLRGC